MPTSQQHPRRRGTSEKRSILLLVVLPAAFLLATAGCLFPSQEYRPVSHYDINIEQEIAGLDSPLPYTIRIGQFTAVGPYDKRMLYRKSEHRVVHDEYNRWIQPPAQLAAQAFYRGFSQAEAFNNVSMSPAAETDLILTGNILRWETTPDLQADIEISLQIRNAESSKPILHRRYHQKNDLDNTTPEAFAAATANALRDIISHSLQDCKEKLQENPKKTLNPKP